MSVIVERVIESHADGYYQRLARELPLIEAVEITVYRGTATCNKPCRPGCNIRQSTREGYVCSSVTQNGDAVTGETSHYKRALCGMKLR